MKYCKTGSCLIRTSTATNTKEVKKIFFCLTSTYLRGIMYSRKEESEWKKNKKSCESDESTYTACP